MRSAISPRFIDHKRNQPRAEPTDSRGGSRQGQSSQTQPCPGTKRTVSNMKRAGDGNRTRVVGLGSRSFTIKLRPHVTAVEQLSVQVEPCADMLPSAARTSLQLHDENASPHRTSCTPQTLHDTGHAILHETSAHATRARAARNPGGTSGHALRGGRSRPSMRLLPSAGQSAELSARRPPRRRIRCELGPPFRPRAPDSQRSCR